MKKLIQGLLVALLLVPTVFAQTVKSANFTIRYNVNAGSMTYCRVTGIQGNPFGGPIAGSVPISTVGSSTTVTGTAAFTLLSVGDVILVSKPDGTTDVRIITAKASADSVTVDTAVDWSAVYSFRWEKQTCGTTANDGWIDVEPYADKTIIFEYNQGDATVDMRLECKASYLDAAPVIAYPGEADACGTGGTLVSGNCEFAAAGIGITNRLAIAAFEPWSQCRVGLNAAADPSDAGANLEKVTVGIIQRQRQ